MADTTAIGPDLAHILRSLTPRRVALLRIFAAEFENFKDPFHQDKLKEHGVTKGELMWLAQELAVLARAAADVLEDEAGLHKMVTVDPPQDGCPL